MDSLVLKLLEVIAEMVISFCQKLLKNRTSAISGPYGISVPKWNDVFKANTLFSDT